MKDSLKVDKAVYFESMKDYDLKKLANFSDR